MFDAAAAGAKSVADSRVGGRILLMVERFVRPSVRPDVADIGRLAALSNILVASSYVRGFEHAAFAACVPNDEPQTGGRPQIPVATILGRCGATAW